MIFWILFGLIALAGSVFHFVDDDPALGFIGLFASVLAFANGAFVWDDRNRVINQIIREETER